MKGCHLQALDGSQVCLKMAGQHARERLHVGGPDLVEDVAAVAVRERHQELVPQQHVLLQDLDVGLGLPQRIDPVEPALSSVQFQDVGGVSLRLLALPG